MAFLDSVYWIAIKHQKDKWHQKAVALRSYVITIDRIYITEGILIETGNFLLRKENSTIAQQVLNDLLSSSKITLLENNQISRKGTLKIMKKYAQLSFTDANIVWHMRNSKVLEVLSFDSGFDGIPDIFRKF